MNASLRDLKRRADGLAPPAFDIGGIVAVGDARLRRRRAGAAAGAVGLAVAAIVAGATLSGSTEQTIPPGGGPTPSVSGATATRSAVRPITYADVPAWQAPDWRTATIHYGDEALRLGRNLHLDLTDDGLVMVSEEATVYFWDGSEIHDIGEVTLDLHQWSDSWVKTSPTGSTAAWFTPEGPDRRLVAYDTRERDVLATVAVPGCESGQCSLVAVLGARVYWTSSPGDVPRLKVLDIGSGEVSDTDANALADDVRAHPRGFVKGDSFGSGEVVNQDVNTEAVFFHPVGDTLELSSFVREGSDGEGVYAYGGFDTSGRRLNLRLPEGYETAEAPYVLFQWLDDDRFAVMSGATHTTFGNGWNGFRGYGDILVCDIVKERCTPAADGPADDDYRLVPHLDVPN